MMYFILGNIGLFIFFTLLGLMAAGNILDALGLGCLALFLYWLVGETIICLIYGGSQLLQ